MLQEIQLWFTEQPITTNILIYLVWIVLIFLVIGWIRRALKRNLPYNAAKYKTQKGVEIIGYIIVVLVTITYFTGSIKDLGLAIGLLTAGITITLQELILTIAGLFYIFFVNNMN